MKTYSERELPISGWIDQGYIPPYKKGGWNYMMRIFMLDGKMIGLFVSKGGNVMDGNELFVPVRVV